MRWHSAAHSSLSAVAMLLFVVLAFLHAVAASNASVACASLVRSLGNSIVQSSGTTYTAAASGAWNLLNDVQLPSCIVFPRTATHVQTAMRAIFAARSQYSVQSGGHSAMRGWNNVNGGVLIHFKNMAAVSYDAASGSITLEPGVRWGDAVSALAPQGVAPVGGRVSDVGTGLLLGGGLSFLSPEHGFAADTIRTADVVLPNGTMITASTAQHADLFRALKGGGNRFGIVTKYVVDAVQTGTASDLNWFGGTITYANSSVHDVLVATADYIAKVTDPKAVLLVACVSAVTGGVQMPFIIVNVFYHGPALPDAIFRPFLSIPALDSVLGPLSYVGVASTLDPGNEHGSAQHYGASALVGDVKLFSDAFAHWVNFTNVFANEVAGSGIAFTPVLQHQIDRGRARGGNAIDPPNGPYAAVQLAQQLAPDVSTISPALQAGIDLLFQQVPRSPGKPFFMNECDRKQNVYATYGDYEFLKATYHKYDPTRFIVNHMDGPVGL